MSDLPSQAPSVLGFSALPRKDDLTKAFVGKLLSSLRTPAVVIDRARFRQNCDDMLRTAAKLGASFRAHVKSHKTAEGLRMQLQGEAGSSQAIVVSTVMEAEMVVKLGLVAQGVVKDILLGFPLPPNKIADLATLHDVLSQHDGTLHILLDHEDQLRLLKAFASDRGSRRWHTFIKVDCGYGRAGVSPQSAVFESLLSSALASPQVALHGFYTHAGHSYASHDSSDAARYLSSEIKAVDAAAGKALSIVKNQGDGTGQVASPFILSVGSTPSARSASPTLTFLNNVVRPSNGQLELHAGNYPLFDLQQVHTGCSSLYDVSISVLASVVSLYPGRANGEADEALIDAGGIALSKDRGPFEGFGWVVTSSDKETSHAGWEVDRVSQEHGLLIRRQHREAGTKQQPRELHIGDLVRIVPQHACMTLAAHPWIYVVDSEIASRSSGALVDMEAEVIDVWVPWKGW